MLKHKHLLIRAEVKKPVQTEQQTIDWMKKLITKIDMNILAGPYSSKVSKKGNKGLSGVAIIDTSHIGIHTWDETDPALIQLDVYSCKDFNIKDVVEHIKSLWIDEDTIQYKFLDRENGFRELNG